MSVETDSLPRQVFAHGFSRRKRAIVRSFAGAAKVRFIRHAGHVPAGGTLLLWGSKPAPPGLAPDVRLVRMEDGFLRSVGLGADLVRPVSWVVDRRGIYYDATRPSDLECLLQEAAFPPALLARAARLRERIVETGLTKYNVGSVPWRRPVRPDSRQALHHVILVPGQVESDASLRFGASPGVTNMGLLKAVRETNPDAYVVYKPHPDVVAGLRARGQGEESALRWCDEVVADAAMGDLLAQVDEVHVLTSLAGFEALLRGRTVVCHGQPFYAGWGLTRDARPAPRRTRRLSLDELVAGALILYPSYVSRATGLPVTPEQALEELLAWRERAGSRVPWWRKVMRLGLAVAERYR